MDLVYFDFIAFTGNGGFFFDGALQLYDLGDTKNCNNILLVNTKLVEAFGEIFSGLFSFGQDIFGNQFVFDQLNNQISVFNIEDGSRTPVAKSFAEWLVEFTADLDYFSGWSYQKQYTEKYELPIENRIVPIKPFVIQGAFTIDNFFDTAFPEYIIYNADIAKQIFHLEEGKPVKLILGSRKQ
ncbi:hypothetical protein SAMN05428949_1824 [Chitinophaga sp. YR627]|nr:hypothetical protein SAMN05428949_1824 [Chitinophaga sp. YR627]